jgi:glycosyltransferase involved in cell wall biosynthesis
VPTILHIIETLGRGGAEVLFVDYINAMPPSFNNIVVYLKGPATLEREITNAACIYCLHLESKIYIPKVSLQLNSIIKKHKADLIHSHLYWPTIVARGANLGNIPHIFSVHTLMTYDAFGPNVLSKYLEKLTYSDKQIAAFVSEAARRDYGSHINVSGDTVLLYNFVRDAFFKQGAAIVYRPRENELKLVSVGNLRPQKGHLFLIEAMQTLSAYNITLDIYGEGHQRGELESYINQNAVKNVRLMGNHTQPENILNNYDAFVLATQYEGFCLAMAEAMAVGLPCVVPAIDALIEVSGNKQLYFQPGSFESFKEKVLMLYKRTRKWLDYASSAREQSQMYTKAQHIEELVKLYERVLRR